MTLKQALGPSAIVPELTEVISCSGSPVLCEQQQPLVAKKAVPHGFIDPPEPTQSELNKWRKTFEQFATADSPEEGK